MNFQEVQPHYRQILPFIIDYMWLQIKPDFDPNSLKDCMLGLDIAEIHVHHLMSLSDSLPAVSYDVLQKQDKLNIKLGGTLNKDNPIDLAIGSWI